MTANVLDELCGAPLRPPLPPLVAAAKLRLPAAIVLIVAAAAGAGCPSRELPPPPADDPKHDEGPSCGKVFKDPKARGGAQCCVQPTAGLLKSADVVAACGVAAAAYLGEARDGAACRLHFQAAGQRDSDDKQTYVMVSRPIIPTGAPAPVAPDPLLPWKWKKVALRDALGYEAMGASDEPGLLEKQTVLWAGRGRRIVGLHVSKQLCTPAQAEALLQKAIDAVP